MGTNSDRNDLYPSLENFYVNPAPSNIKDDPQGDNDNYLIVRSLKNKEGV
jgi:hypothetical protein